MKRLIVLLMVMTLALTGCVFGEKKDAVPAPVPESSASDAAQPEVEQTPESESEPAPEPEQPPESESEPAGFEETSDEEPEPDLDAAPAPEDTVGYEEAETEEE